MTPVALSTEFHSVFGLFWVENLTKARSKRKLQRGWQKGRGREVEVGGIFMFASLQNIKMMREIWQQTKHNKWGNKRDGYRNGKKIEIENEGEG